MDIFNRALDSDKDGPQVGWLEAVETAQQRRWSEMRSSTAFSPAATWAQRIHVVPSARLVVCHLAT